MYDFYSAIGFCNEKLKLYLASDLTKVENPRPQDEDETLEVLEVSLEEAKEVIQSGHICDAKTIMAVQYWELQKNERRSVWVNSLLTDEMIERANRGEKFQVLLYWMMRETKFYQPLLPVLVMQNLRIMVLARKPEDSGRTVYS